MNKDSKVGWWAGVGGRLVGVQVGGGFCNWNNEEALFW